MFGTTIVMAFAFATADPPQPRDGERICRGGGQRTLGSHIRARRRCLTAEQWRAEDARRETPATGVQITAGQNDGRSTATPR